MNSKKYSLSQRGFTLVELLIVIVIIGILAGVVIGVLNPVQQQNRAKDASIRAQIDKMALSTKSLYASSPRGTNRSPTQTEFIGGLANVVAGHNCTSVDATATDLCTFSLNGVTLVSGGTLGCAATGYQGSGAAQCLFAYRHTPNAFWVAGKGWANPQLMFLYYYLEDTTTGNVTEGFYSCPLTWVAADGVTGCSVLN